MVSACATSSPAPDLRRIAELTQAQTLPELPTGDIDETPVAQTRELLASPLDADAAVRLALLNNRELRAQLREVGVARGSLVAAQTLPNPQFELEFLPERNSEMELRLEVELTQTILAAPRARAAKDALHAAHYRAAAAVLRTGYDVRDVFYAAQAAAQSVALAEQSVDAMAASRDASQALVGAGNLPLLHVATQTAAYEHARVRLTQLVLVAANRKEDLQSKLGLHGNDTNWSLVERLPPVPKLASTPEDVETAVLRASLDLKQTRNELDALGRRIGIARTEGWLPDIAVDVHALVGDPSVQGNSSWRFGGGFSVRPPIFDQNRGEVLRFRAQFDALLERYYGGAIALRAGARKARNALQSAFERARHFEDVLLPAQREVTAQTLLQYNAMQVSVFDVVRARQEELSMELEYVETLREYWTARAAMDVLLAGANVDAMHLPSTAMPAQDAAPGGHG